MAKRKKSGSISKKMQIKSSASTSSMHNCYCCGDSKGLGWVIFIVGVLYLLTDLGWMSWWNISWWTILFLIYGLIMIKKY